MMVIQKRDYKLNGLLEDGSDAVDELANEFENGNSAYVCDMVSEIADSYTPMYYNSIWENAKDISEYIEQAVSDGLVDTRNLDLMKTFQAGYYVYYTEALYDNFEVIAFNKVANDVNIYISEQNKSVDEDLVEYAQNIRSGQPVYKPYEFTTLKNKQVERIKELVDVDTTGFKTVIAPDEVRHIEARHGAYGAADHSMEDLNDLGRAQWVIENCDSIEKANNLSKNKRNSDNTLAKQIVYKTNIILICIVKFIISLFN